MALEKSTLEFHSNPDIPVHRQMSPSDTLSGSGCASWQAGVDLNVTLDVRSPTCNSLSSHNTSNASIDSQPGQRDASSRSPRRSEAGADPASPHSAASGGKRGKGLAAGGQDTSARTSKSSGADSHSNAAADPADATGILADLVAEKVSRRLERFMSKEFMASLHETLASSIVKKLIDAESLKSPSPSQQSSFGSGDPPFEEKPPRAFEEKLPRRPSIKAFSQSCSLAVFATERQCLSANTSRRNSRSSLRPQQEAIKGRLIPQSPSAGTSTTAPRPRRFSVSSTSMFGDLESALSDQLLQGLSAGIGSPMLKKDPSSSLGSSISSTSTFRKDTLSDAVVPPGQISPERSPSPRAGSVGKSVSMCEDYGIVSTNSSACSSEMACGSAEAPVWDLALDDTFRDKPVELAKSLSSTNAVGQSLDFRGVDSLRQSNTDNVVRRSLKVKDNGMAFSEIYNDDHAISDLDGVFSDDPCYKIWMPSMLLLRVCGVLPWCLNQRQRGRRLLRCQASWYQWLILSIAALGAVTSLYPILSATSKLQQSGALCYSEACLKIGLLSDVPLAFGALGGLISLGALFHSQRLGEARELMQSYAMNEHFVGRWAIATRRDLVFVLLLWFVAVLERIRGSGVTDGTLDTWATLHVAMFAVNSLILVAVSLCVLYICQGLICAVDAFCLVTILGGTLDEAVPKWNMVQAMLRKGSASIQACLAVLQATVVFTFFLGAFDVYQSAQQEHEQAYTTLLIPGALLPLGVLSTFFKASNVTDRCARVPSLLNSITWEDCEEMDMQRQYVVQYVLYSEPGFYIFEICLTSRMTLQFAYVIMIGMFYVVSNTLVQK